MGRGAAPAPARLNWSAPALLLILTTLVLCTTRISANVCPHYCICNVTMQSFHHVICERASMDSVPRQLPSKDNTTYLNLKWNRLTNLRERDLDNFKKLQALVLDHNQLATIDVKAFHQCPRLKLLRLAHNNLRSLDPDMFQKNILEFLDLSYNKLILHREQPFLKSSSLVFLNLTATDLSEIPVSAFSEMPHLGQLELNNNLLTRLNVKALSVFRKANVTVLVAGNPLRCDCELKATWAWVWGHVPAGSSAPLHAATCNQPEGLRGRSWAELQRLSCEATGASGGGGGCGGGRRKHRLAPPVGEYIDVLEEPPPPAKDPMYDALRDPGAEGKDPDGERRRRDFADTQRYVTDLGRNTYLAPVNLRDDEPIYVNMKGPPLPLRRPSDAPPPPGPAPAPAPAQSRPCSIPLLEGCDFYEVVD